MFPDLIDQPIYKPLRKLKYMKGIIMIRILRTTLKKKKHYIMDKVIGNRKVGSYEERIKLFICARSFSLYLLSIIYSELFSATYLLHLHAYDIFIAR